MERSERFALGVGTLILGLILLSRKTMADDSSDSFTRWDTEIKKVSKIYRVPWRWIKAIAMIESDLGRAKSVARGLASPSDIEGSKSSDGKSWGIMQVTLPTAETVYRRKVTAVELNNALFSLDAGARVIRRSIDRFGLSDRESIVRSYNGGLGFRSTPLGQTWTVVYYQKFLAALSKVKTRHPGDELEIG